MATESRYRFVVRTETNKNTVIILGPAEGAESVIPGDLEFWLLDKVTDNQAHELEKSLTDNVETVYHKAKENTSELAAAWCIGPYLVFHTLFLVSAALLVWLPARWDELAAFVGCPHLSNTLSLTAERFNMLQRLVLSACAAGLGGGVFMIREFYLKFCYGRNNEFLKLTEVPRYMLLPFSSITLGPISVALTKAGAITFGGLSANAAAPLLTVVGVSFILGFAYHDTLNWLGKLSRKIFGSSEDGDAKSPKKGSGASNASSTASPRR